jgi:hypothetical protein
VSAAIHTAAECYDDAEEMKANLGQQDDPRFKLMMELSYEDVRRLEVLTYAAAQGWSLEDASAGVRKEPQQPTVSHLLTKQLQRDLIVGWAKALRAGIWDLRSWNPDDPGSSEDSASNDLDGEREDEDEDEDEAE